MSLKRFLILTSTVLVVLVAGVFITYQYFSSRLSQNNVAIVKAQDDAFNAELPALPADVEIISDEEYMQAMEVEVEQETDDEFRKYIENEFEQAVGGITVQANETVAVEDAEFENDDEIFERVEITDRIYNVLLLGDDARINQPRARSDTMILVSYNRDTRTVYLTSFMRDMLVPTSLSGGSWNRINAIYPAGGPGRAINVVNNLFSLDTQRYAIVRFSSVFALVDQLDGLDLNLRADEAAVINRIFPEYDTMKEGLNHMNGRQVLAYARMRKVDATGDFNRTLRQRYVIRAALDKVLETKKIGDLLALANFALDNIETNVPLDEILTLGYELFSGSRPVVEELRLPVDGSYSFARYNAAFVITFDFRKNITSLHEFIYGGAAGVRIPSFNRPAMDPPISEDDGDGDEDIDDAKKTGEAAATDGDPPDGEPAAAGGAGGDGDDGESGAEATTTESAARAARRVTSTTETEPATEATSRERRTVTEPAPATETTSRVRRTVTDPSE